MSAGGQSRALSPERVAAPGTADPRVFRSPGRTTGMDLPANRRREAAAVGAFGAAFLLVFVVEAVLLATQLSVALPVAFVVGLLVAGLAFARTG